MFHHAYRIALVLPLVLLCLLLPACGVQDIGSTYEPQENIRTSVQTAEQMRLPLSGSDPNQKMLYRANLMQTMLLQQAIVNANLRAPNGPTRELTPKEASPFRE